MHNLNTHTVNAYLIIFVCVSLSMLAPTGINKKFTVQALNMLVLLSAIWICVNWILSQFNDFFFVLVNFRKATAKQVYQREICKINLESSMAMANSLSAICKPQTVIYYEIKYFIILCWLIRNLLTFCLAFVYTVCGAQYKVLSIRYLLTEDG